VVVCLRDQRRDFIFGRAVFNLAIGPNRFVSNLDNASGAVLVTQFGLRRVVFARHRTLDAIHRVRDEIRRCEIGSLRGFAKVREAIMRPRLANIVKAVAASAETIGSAGQRYEPCLNLNSATHGAALDDPDTPSRA